MILVSPSLFHFLYFALLLHLVGKGCLSVWVQDDVKLSQKCLFPVQSSTTCKNGTQTTSFRRIPKVRLSLLYSSQANIYVNLTKKKK